MARPVAPRSAAAPEAVAGPPERVVARLRPHARALFWPAVALVLVCGGYGYFAERFEASWARFAVLIAAALLVLLLFLLPYFSWLSRRFIITTRRIVVRRGFFTRRRQELLHTRGYEVELGRGPLQAMFGSGNLRITVAGETVLVLRDIPRARTVQVALHDLMENAASLQAAQRQVMQSPTITRQTTVWTGR
ncbi:PH domain-containing protein [Gryllotalpicola protaetiae]|uniref:PH domain-containing protein n=1 Tax=Gryllotalpicola protaetiae TaxID=2419771 RepID=A0A387BTA1_9MICO|nr:PH domain-containing protein [Gryllotalpicola protaetiae]AYG04266.1 PH domain-containing protein [Gryllotalpicola protaetiae]